MHPDPHALKLYVDGSALENPGGPGGAAGIVEFPEHLSRGNEVIFEEGYVETTNNRMELRACIGALEYVRRAPSSLGISRVLIVTDSLYVNDNHRRAPYWKKNKWKNLDGKPVENSDLWNEFLLLRPKVRLITEVQWIKGKSTPLLKEVDRRAKAAAKHPIHIDRGFRGGKVSRSKTQSRDASSLFQARGQENAINIYRKKMVGRTQEKVYFDLLSEVGDEFVAKYYAYSTPEIANELHRGHCYKVRFGDNSRHPITAPNHGVE